MKQKGFTLIETLVVIAIFAALSIVIAEMYVWQNRVYKVQFSQLIVMNDARSALDDIDNYVRSANLVLSTYSTYVTDVDTLILQVQSFNTSNQLIPGVYDTVVYYKTGNALFRQVFPDAASNRPAQTKQLAANASNLVFTYNNVDFSQVTDISTTITVLDTNQVQNQTLSVSSKSHLRNH